MTPLTPDLQRRVVVVFTLFAGGLAVASFLLPFAHDYPSYAAQWQRVLEGWHPYENAAGDFKMFWYGPLHHVFALFYAIHPSLPRALFCIAWVAAAGLVVLELLRARASHLLVAAVVAVAVLNPYVFKLYYYGQNDLFVGALLVFAVYAHRRGWMLVAALLLGLATSYKVYPIVLVPFLAYRPPSVGLATGTLTSQLKAVFHPHRFERRFIAGFVLFAGASLGLLYAVYGTHGLASYLGVLDRPATSSSLYFFAERVLSLKLAPAMSIALGLAGLATVAMLYVSGRVGQYPALVAAIIVVFTTSRVFYFSYQVCVLLLLPYVAALGEMRNLMTSGSVPPAHPSPSPEHASGTPPFAPESAFPRALLSARRDRPELRGAVGLYFGAIVLAFAIIFVGEHFTGMSMKKAKGLVYAIPNIILLVAIVRSKRADERSGS